MVVLLVFDWIYNDRERPDVLDTWPVLAEFLVVDTRRSRDVPDISN